MSFVMNSSTDPSVNWLPHHLDTALSSLTLTWFFQHLEGKNQYCSHAADKKNESGKTCLLYSWLSGSTETHGQDVSSRRIILQSSSCHGCKARVDWLGIFK